MEEYLVIVKNKNDIEFLKEYGKIRHVTKLKDMVILNSEEMKMEKLKNHPSVLGFKKSRVFKLG